MCNYKSYPVINTDTNPAIVVLVNTVILSSEHLQILVRLFDVCVKLCAHLHTASNVLFCVNDAGAIKCIVKKKITDKTQKNESSDFLETP